MRLPDGRRLAWTEWGPVDGLPVVFCTGAAMSGWLGFGAGDLADLGMRLLAVDRPGLGRSDPHPPKTLASWVDDMRAFVRANVLGTPLAVGFSQGAPFALALAEAGLVHAVAIVSGQDDLSHPRLKPLLHPDVAALVDAVRSNPDAVERRMAETATKDRLWQLILDTSSDRDRSVYLSEPFREAFRRALLEGFAQGARGYARDLVNALGPWPPLEAVGVPVDLWYGGLDTSAVHSPDAGATLAARLPRAARTVDPDEGGSLLWTRARDILAGLKAHTA